jgi:hypothetical protein
MKFDFLIQTLLNWSPGFSRIRHSWQDVAALAGMHRLKPGLLDILYPDYFSKFMQPHSDQTLLDWSPGFSRIRHSWQDVAALAGMHRLKPGLLDIVHAAAH